MQNHSRMTGILILIVGIILLLFPGSTLNTLCLLLGWCLVAGGIIEIIIGVIGEKIFISISGGIVSTLVGVVFIARPDIIITFLPFIVGLATTAGGAVFLIRTLMQEDRKNPVAVLTVIGSAAAVVAGIFLMVNAYTAVKLLMVILGIFLIYFGVMRILKT